MTGKLTRSPRGQPDRLLHRCRIRWNPTCDLSELVSWDDTFGTLLRHGQVWGYHCTTGFWGFWYHRFLFHPTAGLVIVLLYLDDLELHRISPGEIVLELRSWATSMVRTNFWTSTVRCSRQMNHCLYHHSQPFPFVITQHEARWIAIMKNNKPSLPKNKTKHYVINEYWQGMLTIASWTL